MQAQDWTLLGIEPTTALGAIKKAYALKLRVTRPDDDAEAYQALRTAYERAQQWAKWQAAEARDAVAQDPAAAVGEPVPPEPAAAPMEAPPAVTEDVQPLPARMATDSVPASPVDPSALIQSLELSWRRAGGAALWADWPAAREQLDAAPLRLRADVSAQFARWMLRLPQLPDDFVVMLNDYFGWLDDFRVEREIGADLVQALHEALDSRLLRPLKDPALLALADPLLRFNARRRPQRWLVDQAFAIVLQPLLARLLRQIPPQLMRRLGLQADDQAALHTLTTYAAWLRFGLIALGFFGISVALGGRGGETMLQLLSWAITSVLMLGGIVIIGGLVNAGVRPASSHRIGRLLQGWRQHRSQPLMGVGLILLVAALAYFDVKVDALGWLLPALLGLVALAGLWLAWPADAGHGFVCVGVSPLVCTLFALWLLPALPTATQLLLSLAWMLAAAGVQEGRVPASDLLQWPFRPMLNSFVIVDRWGLTTAMLPLFCTFAYAMLPGRKPDGVGLFLTWVLSTLALNWLQSRGEAWALARLSRA